MKNIIAAPLAHSGRSRSPLVTALVAGGLGSACTLSNTSEGGAEGLQVETRQESSTPSSIQAFLEGEDNPLATLVEVEEADARVLTGGNWVLGSMLSEVGAYYSAVVKYQPGGDLFVPETEQCEGATLPDAVELICQALLDEGLRFVFIDDTAHFAQHRVLGRRVLECAREAGFEYLAVEALEEEASALVTRGFVSRTLSGPYMREPQLAGLVEEGLRLGFTPVTMPAGEFCTTCTIIEAFSEYSEAKATSLLAQTADINPDARVLVWTNQGQAFEQPWGPRPFVNSLAAFVFERTGVDPYTTTQVTVGPNAGFGPESPSGMYLATGPENGSCSGSYSPGSATGLSTHDGVVVHVPPRAGTDTERWDWLHSPPEERMSVTPECAVCAAGDRLLVQAFPAGVDVADRVASDQALCSSGAPCQLSLPAGDYQLVVWTEEAQLTSAEVSLVAGTSTPISTN
jgi:hypothetical protein